MLHKADIISPPLCNESILRLNRLTHRPPEIVFLIIFILCPDGSPLYPILINLCYENFTESGLLFALLDILHDFYTSDQYLSTHFSNSSVTEAIKNTQASQPADCKQKKVCLKNL